MKPRPQLPGVKERVTQFKFAAIEIKSLDELRKGTNTDIPSSPTSSAPQQGFQTFVSEGRGGGVGNSRVVKVEQSQRNFGGPNSNQFRFVPGQARNSVSSSSQNHNTQPRSVQIVDQVQVEREESKTKIPSFKYSAVLKDVKSRLNSSKSDESAKSTLSSSTPSFTGNNAALTTGASSGVPIPTMDVSSTQGSIFSQWRLKSKETANSIFNTNFHQNPEQNNIVLTRDVKISTEVQSSNKSTPSNISGDDESTTITTQKRPRELELAKPDAKRVS